MTSKIKEFPGISLSEQDFKDGKVLFNFDRLNGIFAWDTGIGIGTYLASLKAGVILGSYCPTCRKTVIPPRTVCEWCFRPMEQYVPLKDTGTVNTFSLCYVTWDVKRIKEPEIPAVIEIDGASPLHGIMHMLGEVDTKDVRVGMRVQAVWKPAEERQGSINDIMYFKPIKEA
jgi:uncharacterized OB-fold protein